MPLIDPHTRKCVFCLQEDVVKKQDWVLSTSDPTVFHSPPCSNCGSTETFCWHDTTFFKTVEESRDLPPGKPNGPTRKATYRWVVPDPESFDAQHMVLIEEVALGLKLEKKRLDATPGDFKYDAKPKRPTKTQQRARVETMKYKAERNRRNLRTKDAIEDIYLVDTAHAGLEMAGETDLEER